jgi:hypothetical protein
MKHKIGCFNYPTSLKPTVPNVFFSLLLTCSLAACSGSDSSDDVVIANISPTVDAGTEQTVVEDSAVTLTGTATDTDGSIASYQWSQSSGTAVTLSTDTSATTSFTSPLVSSDETLTFTLTATDNDGATSSDTISVLITDVTATNTAPIADAGSDQAVFLSSTIELTGAQSTDAEGDALTYVWSINTLPNGSVAFLLNESSVSPSFTADVVGNYIVDLTVNDGVMSSESDSVEITVSDITAGSTDGILCDYNYNEFNDSASVSYTSSAVWNCTDGVRGLVANGIPDHEVGEFPNSGNPNTISEQDVSASYTLEPIETETATTLGGPTGPAGYVLNGVKIDASTAGSCDDSGDDCSLIDNSGSWSIEALGHTSFDFGTDDNNAHVQPGGTYHYHGMPEGFVTKQGGNDTKMTIIGWAADGFPIYARYGYSVASDNTSELKSMTGSYQLKSNVSSSRPSTEVYSLGTFAQDWEYVAGLGDLDECNGRVGVTPEFPDGIYHYYATDTYPYFQRCVTGEVEATGGMPPRP